MLQEITLNGVETREICPVCLEENVQVQHGHNVNGGPCHYWHCPNPECSNRGIVHVGYPCSGCGEEGQGT